MDNILVDYTSCKAIPKGAVSIHLFTARLLQGFNQSNQFHPILAVWRGMEDYWDNLAGFHVDKIVVDEKDKVTFSAKLDRILALIPFENELKKLGIRAVITPEYVPYMFIYPRRYHQHLIIHDLFTFHYPRKQTTLWQKVYNRFMLMVATERVSHLITISQNTRNDVQKFAHHDSDVVYNSIPFDFHIEAKTVPEVSGKPFILDVNRFYKYKNAQLLIEALSLIKNQIPHVIYFKGYKNRQEEYDWLQKIAKKMGVEDRVIFDISFRSEAEMRYLYTHADLFVTPSLNEGFGYTPIEAAILKTPVLMSDIPTLQEVTRGKIESFDPHNAEELAQKMLRIIQNPPSMEERQKLSDFYINEYSLEKQIDGLTKVIMRHKKG